MQTTAQMNLATVAWNAARAAVEAAPEAQSDGASFVLMALENAIAATPVTSMEDAALHLNIAMVMAERMGAEDDQPWKMVAAAAAVKSVHEAAQQLQAALAIAECQGEEDDASWMMVAAALAFLQRVA